MNAANLTCYFPPWTVTRGQWSEMTRPSISGVAINTVIQPHWGPVVSPLSDHQSYGDSCGFPGNVYATVACLSGGIGCGIGSSTTSPVHQGAGGMHVAVIRSGLSRRNAGCFYSTQSLVGQSPGPGDLASQCGGLGLLGPRKRFPYFSRKRTLYKL